MLCLQSANTGGRLITQIGDLSIPTDIKKIVRDSKYFDYDTVTIAIELFKSLGLVTIENEVITIPECAEMVGSESANPVTERVRKSRAKKKMLENGHLDEENDSCNVTSVSKNVTNETECNAKNVSQRYKCNVTSVSKCNEEYRVKSIEYRDKSLDNRDLEIKKNIFNCNHKSECNLKRENSRFHTPTLDEIEKYLFEKNYSFNAERFFNYYSSTGWKIHGDKITDWRACADNWQKNEKVFQSTRGSPIEENTSFKTEDLANIGFYDHDED